MRMSDARAFAASRECESESEPVMGAGGDDDGEGAADEPARCLSTAETRALADAAQWPSPSPVGNLP